MKKSISLFIVSISVSLIISCNNNSATSPQIDSTKSDSEKSATISTHRDSINYDWEKKMSLEEIFDTTSLTEKLDSGKTIVKCTFIKDQCEEIHPSTGEKMNKLFSIWLIKNYPDWSNAQTEIQVKENGKLYWVQLLKRDDGVKTKDFSDGEPLVLTGRYFKSKLDNKCYNYFIVEKLQVPPPH